MSVQHCFVSVLKGNTDQPAPSIARVDLFPKDVTPLQGNAFVFLGTLVVKFYIRWKLSYHVLIEYIYDSISLF